MEQNAAYIITDILADRASRSTTFGLDNPLATRFWSAVKTGTSKDMRDNWCIGFSRRYTVGVWVGNFSGAPMWNVSGVSGAAPAWLEVMNYLQRNERSTPSSPPAGVRVARVVFKDNSEAARSELFLAGTEPTSPAATVARPDAWRIPRIAYPPAGTIIVRDPDIPEGNQLVFFMAENSGTGETRWQLNKELLPPGEEGRRWAPQPGRHELDLVDGSGNIHDSVTFEVR
jgi:penicillin-binding protein 1C